MNNKPLYFYVMKFHSFSETGLAIVICTTERDAKKILRNCGRYQTAPESYIFNEIKCVGRYDGSAYGLMLETYTDAAIVYDAIAELLANVEMKQGLSAYDIAVQHGYVGTEEEWLESLKEVVDYDSVTAALGYVPLGKITDVLILNGNY